MQNNQGLYNQSANDCLNQRESEDPDIGSLSHTGMLLQQLPSLPGTGQVHRTHPDHYQTHLFQPLWIKRLNILR